MPRPRSNISERIVAAARARFLTEGVDGASLRSIAQDAGTNLGMIYYYYPTKDDLFLAVVEDVYAKILDDLAGALREPGDLEATVRMVYRRISSLGDVEYDVIRIIVREALISSERLGKLVDRFSRGHIPLVAGLVQRGLVEGTISDQLPPAAIIAALASLALLPQLVRRRLAAQRPELAELLPAPEALAEALAHVAFHGISSKGDL